MHEIEAKIRVQGFEDVTAKLKTSGATFLRQVRETDTYLDAQGQLKQQGCGLRIRRQETGSTQKAIVTFKGARVQSQYKSRPEYETEISDAEMAHKIFEGLGFKPCVTVEKKRTIWALEDCTVCLDDVAVLGLFVEVEGPDEGRIEAVLKKLGKENEPHVQAGYAEMLHKLNKAST